MRTILSLTQFSLVVIGFVIYNRRGRKKFSLKPPTNESDLRKTTTISKNLVNAECSICNSMEGTVKHYDKHLIILCGDSQWVKRIEVDENGVVYKISSYIEEYMNKINIKYSIKITLCNAIDLENVYNPSKFQAIVYPEGYLYSFDKNEKLLSKFAEYLVSNSQLEYNNFQKYRIEPFWKHLLLVCVHMSRDKRCGRAGPQIIQVLI
jgi:hypothetical protein